MNDALLTRLLEVANATGRPVAEGVRHHFLEGVLRRMAAEEFALRGSMLTRVWAGEVPRPPPTSISSASSRTTSRRRRNDSSPHCTRATRTE